MPSYLSVINFLHVRSLVICYHYCFSLYFVLFEYLFCKKRINYKSY